jgi:peptidoglycan/xylan/chitin deacetylase (PgdA/CDA1 family)
MNIEDIIRRIVIKMKALNEITSHSVQTRPFYLSNTADAVISGYKILTRSNDSALTTPTTTVKQSESDKLIYAFLLADAVGTTTIDAGTWTFDMCAGINSCVGVTRFKFVVFKRDTGGTETTLFSVTSNPLKNLTANGLKMLKTRYTQPPFTVATTDRIGVKVYVLTNNQTSLTVSVGIGGTATTSYISTPIPLSHSEIIKLNGDTAYQHINNADRESISNINKSGSKIFTKKIYPADDNDLGTGEIIEDFGNASAWTGTNLIITNDTTNFQVGTQSINFEAAASSTLQADKPINFTVGYLQTIVLSLYCYNLNFDSVYIYFITSNSSVNLSYRHLASNLKIGLNNIKIPITSFTSNGGALPTSVFTTMRVKLGSATIGASVSLNYTKKISTERAKIIFTFDDGYLDHYTNVLPYFKSIGAAGSLSIISSFIGQSSNMTIDNLKEFKNAGFDICNHSSNLTPLTEYATTKELYNSLTMCNDFIIKNDLDTNGRLICIYPNGEFNDTIIQTIKKLGFVGGRLANGQLQQSPVYGNDYYKLNAKGFDYDYATSKAYVDDAISKGSTLIFYSHSVTNERLEVIKQIISYIKTTNASIIRLSDLFL